jgi:hypothetical protein
VPEEITRVSLGRRQRDNPGRGESFVDDVRVFGRWKEGGMATRERRYGPAGGITLGGIIVIVGIVLMFVWSFWIGLIIAVVGLVAFGGFARGRWY